MSLHAKNAHQTLLYYDAHAQNQNSLGFNDGRVLRSALVSWDKASY